MIPTSKGCANARFRLGVRSERRELVKRPEVPLVGELEAGCELKAGLLANPLGRGWVSQGGGIAPLIQLCIRASYSQSLHFGRVGKS
jgi:predicted alpha/beta-hydrolase family hydrolase